MVIRQNFEQHPTMQNATELKDAIRRRVAAIRKTRGETRREFADSLGVAEAAYYKYENGRSAFPPEVLLEIRDLTGFTTDYIIAGDVGSLPIRKANELKDFGLLEDSAVTSGS